MEATPRETRVATTKERVALARTAHRGVNRTMFVLFFVLAAVILGVGSWLSTQGRTSLPGVLVVGGAFLALPVLMAFLNNRTLRRAERFLAADGETVLRVTPSALVVADLVIPWENVTCVYANPGLEAYSSGGIRGEVMAQRMDLQERDSMLARGVGAWIGTGQRRKLYRDGAKSWGDVMVGVSGRDTLGDAGRLINPLRTLPASGFGSGRIDVPFGAFLTGDDLARFFAALEEPAARFGFPYGLVNGAINWALAQTGAADAPEKIRADAASLLG